MAVSRIRRVSSTKEMEALIDDFITQGYVIVSSGESSAMLRKRTWGTFIGHFICLPLNLFSLGFANVIYALIAHYNAEKVMIKVDNSVS